VNMSVEKQFSVFLVNKPGILAQVCTALADRKINIRALTLVDSQEHGVLRLVVEDGKKTADVLRAINIPVDETEVLCVEMPNQPGAMADICTRLGTKHININYAYCTTGTRGGRTLGVFKVADIEKARKVLAQHKPASNAKKQTVRRSASR